MTERSLAMAASEGPTPAAEAASEGPTPAAEAVVDPGDSEEVTDDREESELEAYNHKN